MVKFCQGCSAVEDITKGKPICDDCKTIYRNEKARAARGDVNAIESLYRVHKYGWFMLGW